MKTAFCTISTNSHLFKVDALFSSLKNVGEESDMVCLATELGQAEIKNGQLLQLEDIELGECGDLIIRKYASTRDHLRWSLKPILISLLLEKYEKVIYLDNDIGFFNSPSFLWNELDTTDILLTPHHYPRDPKKNQNWLEANFKVGLYNAGFIGVNKNAKHIMDWWADCCLYRCEKSLIRGLFDDQKYLDLVPVMHTNTKVLEHKGCNVAGWNAEVCRREFSDDNIIFINGKWPIVFIHFNGFSVRTILHGNDSLLRPYLTNYIEQLRVFKPNLEEGDLWNENTFWDRIKLFAWNLLNQFKK